MTEKRIRPRIMAVVAMLTIAVLGTSLYASAASLRSATSGWIKSGGLVRTAVPTDLVRANAVEFTEDDVDPACASGNYNIYADLSETVIKVCQDGVTSVLGTGGPGVASGWVDDGTVIRLDTITDDVGIGTTSPLKKVDIVGSTRIQGTGTITLTGSIDPAASTAVVGVGTAFTTELVVGDQIVVTGENRTVTAIADATNLTVDAAFTDNADDASPDKIEAEFIVLDAAGNTDFIIDADGNAGFGGIVNPGSAIHLPQEASAATPTIAFGDGDSGFFESSDDILKIVIGGISRYSATSAFLGATSTDRSAILNEDPTATNPSVVPARSDLDTGMGRAAADQLSLIAGGAEIIRLGDPSVDFALDDAVTTAVSRQLTMLHTSSGTAAAGFGTGIEFELEGADTTNLVAGGIDVLWTDADTGAEDSDMVFSVSVGGAAAAEAMRLTSDFALGIGITPVAGTRLTLPLENDAATPTLAFGDGDSGIYQQADNIISFAVAGVKEFILSTNGFLAEGSNEFILRLIDATATVPVFSPNRQDQDTGIGWAAADQLSLIAGGFEMLRLTESTTVDDEIFALFAAPTVTVTSDASSSGHLMSLAAQTYNFDGGVNITTPIDGLAMRVLAPVVASDTSVVITQLSTLYVAAPDVSDAEVTATTNLAAEFDGDILINSNVLIANTGGLVVGHTTQITGNQLVEVQILGTGSVDSSIMIGRWDNSGGSPQMEFIKSRNATIGSHAIVLDNDKIMRWRFLPDDGVDFATVAAEFQVEVDDASPEAGFVGTAFVWRQMPGGNGNGIAETMRLSAAGDLILKRAAIGATSPSSLLTLATTETSDGGLNIIAADDADEVRLSIYEVGGASVALQLRQTTGNLQILDAGGAMIAHFDNDTKNLQIAEIRAQGVNGLKLFDDGGAGIFVQDGGDVGVGIDPTTRFHVDSNGADTVAISTLENTGGNTQDFITSATPEGAITGSIGDMARDHTNGMLYFKRSGSATNTGWVELAQVAQAIGFMNIHANVTALTIDTVSVDHGIRLFSELLTGPDITFEAGETGTITAISDAGGGDITVTATHSLSIGDVVSLSGGTGYDDVYVVQAIATTVSFDITVGFVATGTGTFNEPSTFIVNKTATFKFDWSSSVSAASANKTYEWHVYINATRQEHGAAQIRFASGDISLASGATFLNITSGDRISMFVANLTDTTSLTHLHFDMNLHQI